MAEAPGPSGNGIGTGLEQLEREITCPVCQEYFENPKVLPCQHYYCRKCILALALRVQPFSCPECRTTIQLRRNDPDQLPTAFFVNRLKELHSHMEKTQGSVEVPCEMCSQASSAAFCRQCTYFICSGCVNLHQVLKVFTGHSTVTLDELKQGRSKEMPSKQPHTSTCTVHNGEPLKMYCYDCEQLICRDCIVIDHTGHKFQFVKKVAIESKTEIEQKLDELHNEGTNLGKAIEAVKISREELVAQCMTFVDVIEQSFAQLHDILENHKRSLIAEVTNTTEERTEKLNVQEKGFVTSSTEIQSLIDMVQQNMEHTTDEELTLAHRRILNQIDAETKRHCQEKVDYDPVVKASKKEENLAERLQQGCKNFASQMCLFPPSCIMKSIDTPPEVNRLSRVSLQAHTFPSKMEKLSVELKSCIDESVIQTVCVRKEDNVYDIAFTARLRGRHMLTVSVNSIKVAPSPFPIFVKIPPKQIHTPVAIISDSELLKPWGIAFNSLEEVLVTDYFHNGVVVYNKTGTKAHIFKPVDQKFVPQLCGIAVDKHDNVFVADAGNHCLYKFNKDGNQVSKVGSYGIEQCQFMNPKGVSIVSDQVMICDYGNNRIQVFSTELEFMKQIGTKGSGNGQFDYVRDVAFDEDGHVYVCDSKNDRVQVFDSHWKFLYNISEKGNADRMKNPVNVCLSGQFVYVVENDFGSRHCVSVFLTSGEFVSSFGEVGIEDGKFNTPLGIACDLDGFLYVCDFNNSRVQVF